jgi:membrane protease YdiL (CAAX protease family)
VDGDERRKARRGLLLYFLILLPFSALFECLLIVYHLNACMLLLMWTPAFAAFTCRSIYKDRYAHLSLQLVFKSMQIWQMCVVAIVAPLFIGVCAYGFAWGTGLMRWFPFRASANTSLAFSFLHLSPSFPVLLAFGLGLIIVEIFSAAGEEIGWRGYLLPRLIAAEVPYPVVVNGLIWSLWHLPLVLVSVAVPGVPPLVSGGIFIVSITSLGALIARLSLSTGNLWPAILCHAAWNGWLLEVFDGFTHGAGTSLWTGENGILVAAFALLVALASWSKWWQGRGWKTL